MSKPNPDMLDNYLHELNDDLNLHAHAMRDKIAKEARKSNIGDDAGDGVAMTSFDDGSIMITIGKKARKAADGINRKIDTKELKHQFTDARTNFYSISDRFKAANDEFFDCLHAVARNAWEIADLHKGNNPSYYDIAKAYAWARKICNSIGNIRKLVKKIDIRYSMADRTLTNLADYILPLTPNEDLAFEEKVGYL